MRLAAPCPLVAEHDVAAFDCGAPSLDLWLRKRALTNNREGASRTYVVASESRVVGYYALAAGSVSLAQATGRFRRNMPEPIPVALLARLAVDLSYSGRGLGRALFRDGAQRVLNAAEILGVRGLIVHAISSQAREFYLALGLEPSPLDPLTLLATLTDLRAAL